MFQAMSRCQALHPDPEDEENVAEENEGDEEEDEEGMYGKLSCIFQVFCKSYVKSISRNIFPIFQIRIEFLFHSVEKLGIYSTFTNEITNMYSVKSILW